MLNTPPLLVFQHLQRRRPHGSVRDVWIGCSMDPEGDEGPHSDGELQAYRYSEGARLLARNFQQHSLKIKSFLGGLVIFLLPCCDELNEEPEKIIFCEQIRKMRLIPTLCQL